MSEMPMRWDVDPRGGIDCDTLYTRCSDCQLTGPAGSAEYTLTASGGVDWTRPVLLRCMFCGHRHNIGPADPLERGQTATCSRRGDALRPQGCTARTPYPAGAARVCCTTCRLMLTAPDLTTTVADQLRVTEALHSVELRAATLRRKSY